MDWTSFADVFGVNKHHCTSLLPLLHFPLKTLAYTVLLCMWTLSIIMTDNQYLNYKGSSHELLSAQSVEKPLRLA